MLPTPRFSTHYCRDPPAKGLRPRIAVATRAPRGGRGARRERARPARGRALVNPSRCDRGNSKTELGVLSLRYGANFFA